MLQVFFQDKLYRFVRVKVEIDVDAAADGMVCRRMFKSAACRSTANRLQLVCACLFVVLTRYAHTYYEPDLIEATLFEEHRRARSTGDTCP